ncbi:MAG: ABC transporter permease, partial [Paracoccaceae bacterium]
MSLSVAAKIARRELRGGLKGFRVFLACLTLGIAAIAAVGTVRESVRQGLAREGAVILGGDAEIELTYRFASDDERLWMTQNSAAFSEIVDFRSMAVVDRGSVAARGLTQVKAVDSIYPLYGSVALEPDIELAVAFAGKNGIPGAVMDGVLVERLRLSTGDIFRLGTQEFVLSAILLSEPDNSGGAFTLGPRTIVRTTDLTQSGLLQPGTLFESAYRLQTQPGADLDRLESDANIAINSGGFHWRDRRNAAPGATEFIDRLGTFLILVGLAGLAVGGVGVAAAVRTYLDEKIQVIATLKTLGADGKTVFQAYLMQIGVMTVIGVASGILIGALLPIALAPLIKANLPLPVVLGLHPRPLLEAALYGVLTAILFTLWPLSRTASIRAAALFRDASLGLSGWPGRGYIAICGFVLMLLIAAAAWFSGNPRLAFWVAGGLFAVFLMLSVMAYALRRLTRWCVRFRIVQRFTPLRLALGSVGGPGGEAASVVLSLGLGLAVLATVGQIDANLRSAISRDLPDRAPTFFVVDIQSHQMQEYLALVQSNPAVTKVQ